MKTIKTSDIIIKIENFNQLKERNLIPINNFNDHIIKHWLICHHEIFLNIHSNKIYDITCIHIATVKNI